MNTKHNNPVGASRREFLKITATAAAVAPLAFPTIVGAQDKSGSKPVVIGTCDYRYECHHGWGELPDSIKWGDTHGVTIDAEGNIYIKHRSGAKEPMDAIVVFDPNGKYIRSFGKEYHGGGHGIDIRKEGCDQYLYLSDTKNGIVAKTTLTGEVIWKLGRPMESGFYDDPKSRYSPTNVAFGPDGSVYIGDGYGSSYIHQYTKEGKWVRSWGGFGSEPGKMKTPHGMWLDTRNGEPELAVCDRANARLQYFSLTGEFLRFVEGLSYPADLDIQGDLMLCPDLHARITLFDKNNTIITHLGYDPGWTAKVLDGFRMRGQPETWEDGKFIHPHDACFDENGNIFVAEWVSTGRVSKLVRV